MIATRTRAARKLVRRFLVYVWDNPSAELDARTILSSPKVGLWLGLEVLLIAITSVVALFGIPEGQRLLVASGAGPYLIGIALTTLTWFLTLIVPLRASGLLEGPRWRGYLDQIVTTGLSPLRYYAGKWATSQPFFLALIGASVPFVVLFGLLGGANWGRTLVTYLLIYLYCNVLLLVAFALGAVLHEVVGVLLTWLIYAGAILLECIPTPSTLASLTPTRFIIQPFVEPLVGANAPVLVPIFGNPRPFGLEIPWPVWAIAIWCGISFVAAISCTLGPIHTFLPGLNNFSAIVLPGDRKRRLFRRYRPFLTRQVELAFLFENRGPALVRWTLPLRSLQQLVFLGGLCVLALGMFFDPIVLTEIPLRDLHIFHPVLVGLFLLVTLYAFSSGRTHAMQRFHHGGLSISQLWFDVTAFILVLSLLVVLHVAGFALNWTELGLPRGWAWGFAVDREDLFLGCSHVLAVFVTVAVSTFLVLKLAGNRVISADATFTAGAGYLVAVIVVPLLAFGLSRSLARADYTYLNDLAPSVFALSLASPAVQIRVALDGLPGEIQTTSWLVEHGFWFWHGLGVLYLIALVAIGQRGLEREASLLLDRVRPDPDQAACGQCRSEMAVKPAFSAAGGVFLNRMLGYVRCLDCGYEFHPSTGQNNRAKSYFVLGLRVLAAGLLLIAATFLLWLGTRP